MFTLSASLRPHKALRRHCGGWHGGQHGGGQGGWQGDRYGGRHSDRQKGRKMGHAKKEEKWACNKPTKNPIWWKGWKQGLVNWAQTFLTHSLPDLRVFLALRVYSAFLCISLHFTAFHCIFLHFTTFLYISLHFSAFFYIHFSSLLYISLHVLYYAHVVVYNSWLLNLTPGDDCNCSGTLPWSFLFSPSLSIKSIYWNFLLLLFLLNQRVIANQSDQQLGHKRTFWQKLIKAHDWERISSEIDMKLWNCELEVVPFIYDAVSGWV